MSTQKKVTDGNKLLDKLSKKYTSDELKKLSNGLSLNPVAITPASYTFEGEEVCVGFVTDTHIGEETFNDGLWNAFITECTKEKVDLILHAGDLIEGMSNRPDQVYHLKDIGFSAQMKHAKRLLKNTPFPIKIIDGNHDRWGVKSGGVFVVKDIADSLDNVEFIGSDCGDVHINGTTWRLFHGEDGSAYATSYRLQKIIESFTGGDKPNVLLTGHDHKQCYIFERNVHAVAGGALSYQSTWMRSTRKACHTGFHIIRATIKDGQITKFSPTFYPFYK